jgi:hypothetical protein
MAEEKGTWGINMQGTVDWKAEKLQRTRRDIRQEIIIAEVTAPSL